MLCQIEFFLEEVYGRWVTQFADDVLIGKGTFEEQCPLEWCKSVEVVGAS